MATQAEPTQAEQPAPVEPAPVVEAPVVEESAPAPKEESKAAPKADKPPAKPKAPAKKPAPTSTILAFNIWDVSGIKVSDEGLKRYISLAPRIVPKTGARYAGNRFHKSRTFIVERLMNKLMVVGHKSKKHKYSSGHNTGQAAKVYDTVREAFKIIEQRTKKNPIAVFVQAIENAAPREEIVNIEYGGARYPKPVECAPQRRIDIALRQMAQGAYHKGFGKPKSAAQSLADEILASYNSSQNSQAIAKKIDLERTADASR